MRKQFDLSIFDSKLKKLDSEFVWSNAKNPDLKAKLIKDMNKIELRSKFTIPLGYLLRISAVGTLLLIVFIIGKHEIMENQNSRLGGSTESIEEYLLNIEQANQDTKDTYTVSEQKQIEGLDGNEVVPLTIDSTIPKDISEDVTFIIGKPKIAVSKNNGQMFAEATYPVFNGEFITVKAFENTYGSIEEVTEALEPTNLKSENRSVSNKDALLFNSLDGINSELLIIADKYLYVIKGENDSSALIKVAEQINFSK